MSFYTTTIEREEEDGNIVEIEVECYFVPGQRGTRSGHPDRWCEEIPDDIEVTSALLGDTGLQTDLTDDEEKEVFDEMMKAADDDAAEAAIDAYEDRQYAMSQGWI